MLPIDPFANMVPLNMMEEDIDYQMACDAGYDPENELNALVMEREEALREEVDEVIPQLWENVNQTFALFAELLKEVCSKRPFRAAKMEVAKLADGVKVLEGHKSETQRILNNLQSHLQEVQAQQKVYQKKLADLQAAKRMQMAHVPFASFVCEGGERYRQTLVYRKV